MLEIKAVRNLLVELGCASTDYVHLFTNTNYEGTVRAIK